MRCAAPTRSCSRVRGGKVASILWMRAQIFGDLGAIAEEQRQPAPRPSGSTARRSTLLEANYPGLRRAAQRARRGSPAISRAAASSRPPRRCSARSSIRSPTPATCRRASPMCCGPMSTCCSRRATIPRPQRRDLRRDPADGPARPRADPGRARARADRRHRRSVAPVPPVGHADPPGRARPDRACAARRTSPSRRPQEVGPRARSSGVARHVAEGAADDPGGARRASRATARSRATRSRSPTCRRSCARAKPITG